MKLVALLAPLALLALTLEGQARGSVFLDRNNNGTRDAGEPGIAGIAVSNQDTVVVTARDGSYAITSRGTGLVFVSVPNDHAAPRGWWRSVTAGADAVDFGLTRNPAGASFSFIHASDTHISAQSRSRTVRLRALVDSLRPSMLLITGDLVRDALRVGEPEATGYYEMFNEEMAKVRVPVWTVPGNHEIFGVERLQSKVEPSHPLYGRAMYRKYRGPDYYSFNAGGIHFIGLNTIDVDDMWYHGQVDAAQLAWLQRDLAATPPGTPVVTFNHIPFFTSIDMMNGYTEGGAAPSVITVNGVKKFRHSVSNARDVMQALRARNPIVALGGHMHTAERLVFPGIPTRFEQAGAVVGPSGGGSMSFPSGITLYRVTNGRVSEPRFVALDPAR